MTSSSPILENSQAFKRGPIIGLLGGIGSGKSTVADLLAKRGMIVLDADEYAGELLEDPEVRKEIRSAFGSEVFKDKEVLTRNGGEKTEGEDTGNIIAGEVIDRAALASRVFACEENRKRINAIIHPHVRTRIREEVASIRTSAPEKIIVLDIPLLVGSELRSLCDLMIMVETSLENRLRRVMADRGWKPEELRRREKYQPSIDAKRKEADRVLRNDGSIDDLEDEIDSFIRDIQKMDNN